MTASALMLDLCRQGAVLSLVCGRLRVEAPRGLLSAEVQATLSSYKAEILRLLQFSDQYRRLLFRGFALIAKAGAGTPEECEQFLDEQTRLADELGSNLAAAIRKDAAERWHADTGRCPWCGEPGDRHGVEVAL